MLASTLALALVASTWSDELVLGVLAGPPVDVAAAAAWLHRETALTVTLGERVGWDRAALATCPPDRLYTCLATMLVRLPTRPRLGLLLSRTRDDGVQALYFDAAQLTPLLGAADTAERIEAQVYGAVLRSTGAGPAALEAALAALAAQPGLERPLQLTVHVSGCAGCVVRAGTHEAAVDGDEATVSLGRMRGGVLVLALEQERSTVWSSTVSFEPGVRAEVRVDIPPPPTRWHVGAAALGTTGLAAVVAGVVLAVGRDTLVCASARGSCSAPLVGDARVQDYERTGDVARVLGISGAALVVLGLAAEVVALAHDGSPQVRVE